MLAYLKIQRSSSRRRVSFYYVATRDIGCCLDGLKGYSCSDPRFMSFRSGIAFVTGDPMLDADHTHLDTLSFRSARSDAQVTPDDVRLTNGVSAMIGTRAPIRRAVSNAAGAAFVKQQIAFNVRGFRDLAGSGTIRPPRSVVYLAGHSMIWIIVGHCSLPPVATLSILRAHSSDRIRHEQQIPADTSRIAPS